MAATNTTTTTQPTTRASTLSSSAASSPSVQSGAASQNATSQAASVQGTGIFDWQLPNIMPSLDQFLGLPTIIDYQDIAIRVAMVVVGVVLVLLVAWAFVRGKQNTTVNVQMTPQQQEQAAEAAEVA